MLDNLSEETKQILLGALIGGTIGVGASLALNGHKKGGSLENMEKLVCRLGEVIESTSDGKSMIKEVEKKLHKEENLILSAIDLAAAGISLWKKLKKAG